MDDRVAARIEQVMGLAMLAGHQLMPWEPLDTGQQSMCRLCRRKVAVWNNGRVTSYLSESCPNQETGPEQQKR